MQARKLILSSLRGREEDTVQAKPAREKCRAVLGPEEGGLPAGREASKVRKERRKERKKKGWKEEGKERRKKGIF